QCCRNVRKLLPTRRPHVTQSGHEALQFAAMQKAALHIDFLTFGRTRLLGAFKSASERWNSSENSSVDFMPLYDLRTLLLPERPWPSRRVEAIQSLLRFCEWATSGRWQYR